MAEFNFEDEKKSGFKLVPQGEQVLTVENVEYQKVLGRVVVFLKNTDGIKMRHTFFLKKNNGEINNVAQNIWLNFGRNVLNKPQGSKGGFDTKDLIGHSVVATVEHTESNDGTTYANLKAWTFKPFVVDEDLDNL